MVPGNPALSISSEGFITVTPTEAGFTVFSVKAEEFRDGVKIGESRRDFQMLVVDGCNPPDPPEALVKIPGQDDFYRKMTLFIMWLLNQNALIFLSLTILELM